MLELAARGTARSLVLVSPGTGPPSYYRAPRLDDLYRNWPFALRRLHETHHGPEHWRQLVTALHVDGVGRSEFSAEALGGVGCPVLMVAGTHDESIRRKQGWRFAEVNASGAVRPNSTARHMPCTMSASISLQEVISAFLAEVDSERAGSYAATEDS